MCWPWGGKRCKYERGCDKSAQGKTEFCKRHGGGKRCSWGQSGLGGQAVATCNKLAKGKLGLCASHTPQLDNLRTHGGSATGPVLDQAKMSINLGAFSLPEGRVHGGSLMAMMRRESSSVGPSKDVNKFGCFLEPGSTHSLPHEWV